MIAKNRRHGTREGLDVTIHMIIVFIQTMKLKCTASVNLSFQNLVKVCIAVYMAFKIKFGDSV